ncbi:hypothetical protein, partial [Pseudomonas aeruginosa]|uniref:hypothetical protein n=1 Tax=Pseudomonas aeruginosa TaxID=287 RepID=UPI001CD96615
MELLEGFGEGGGKERLAWLRGKAGCMVNRPGARFLQGKETDIRRHVAERSVSRRRIEWAIAWGEAET